MNAALITYSLYAFFWSVILYCIGMIIYERNRIGRYDNLKRRASDRDSDAISRAIQEKLGVVCSGVCFVKYNGLFYGFAELDGGLMVVFVSRYRQDNSMEVSVSKIREAEFDG